MVKKSDIRVDVLNKYAECAIFRNDSVMLAALKGTLNIDERPAPVPAPEPIDDPCQILSVNSRREYGIIRRIGLKVYEAHREVDADALEQYVECAVFRHDSVMLAALGGELIINEKLHTLHTVLKHLHQLPDVLHTLSIPYV